MRRPRCFPFRLAAPALFGVLLLTASVAAQQQQGPNLPRPRVNYLSPNGARAGTTVEVAITGGDLEELQGLLFSHPGIKAEQIPDPPPDPKKPAPPRNPNQPMTVKYKVTVPGDVPVGSHDLRVVTKVGVSNPRFFVVGDQNEVMEKEPNNDIEQAQPVELNTTINGVINSPTDVDYFVFKGQKGQKVVVHCAASTIESRAHPVIELYPKGGPNPLAVNRDYHHNDAVLDAVLPADGEYLVRVFQFTHLSGGPDHYYRLTITTAPWIDAVFPPMVEPGKPAQLTVYGRNLPGGQPDPTANLFGSTLEKLTVNVTAPNDPAAVTRLAYSGYLAPPSSLLDGFDYRLKNAAGSSNSYLLMYSRNPVVLDNGKNVTQETAQAIPAGCEVAGRLERAHPVAWYSFDAKKGETYTIELLGDRMGSPLDLAYKLHAPDGKSVVTEQDDDPEVLSPTQFFTRSSDPARFTLKPAADGKYTLMVKSNESPIRAGPLQMYRLRVSPEQPDFRLVVMAPSAYFADAGLVPQNGHEHLSVYVWRRDGFNGPIALSMEGLPPGVVCKPQLVGPGQKAASLIVSADAGAAAANSEVKVKGTATINGQPVVREARAASITWSGNPQQQNVPTFTRLDRGILLAVREKGPYTLTVTGDKFSGLQGDKVTVPIKIDRQWPDVKAPVAVKVLNLPTGVTFNNNNQPMAVANDNGQLVLNVAPNAVPGTYTIAFVGSATFPYARDPMAKQKPNVTAHEASAPVTLTIIPKSLATVALTPPNAQAKLGTNAEVVVKVTRQFDFGGEFKVSLVQPANAQGITAPEVVIPAGKDEVKLVLTVAGDAPVGNRADLIVRAVAMFDGTAVTHDVKFAVNVVK